MLQTAHGSLMTGLHLEFEQGFPDNDTVAAAYDRADFARAVVTYKHFFPAVSGMAILAGTRAAGVVPNSVFGTMDTRPGQVGFTLNCDTPYAPILLDLSSGPLVVDLPPGLITGAALKTDQSWIADLGLAAPTATAGRDTSSSLLIILTLEHVA